MEGESKGRRVTIVAGLAILAAIGVYLVVGGGAGAPRTEAPAAASDEGRPVSDAARPLEGLALAGNIVDEAGAPIEGARVIAYSARPFEEETFTGPGGYFAFDELDRDKYTIRIGRQGYRRMFVRDLKPHNTEIEIVMDTLPGLQLRVVDDTGRVITDFAYAVGPQTIDGEELSTYRRGRLFSPVRGEGGPVEVLVEEMRGVLHILADGYRLWTTKLEDVEEAMEDSVLVARLEPAPKIYGVVRTPEGFPIEGAEVGLNPRDPLVMTGVDGVFAITWLSEVPSFLVAHHDDYVARGVKLDGGPSATEGPHEITLEPGGRIEGMVTINGRPHPNARLEAYYCFEHPVPESGERGAWFMGDRDRVEADGRYSLRGLPQTVTRVRLEAREESHGGHSSVRSIERLVTIVPGQTTVADFDIDASAEVEIILERKRSELISGRAYLSRETPVEAEQVLWDFGPDEPVEHTIPAGRGVLHLLFTQPGGQMDMPIPYDIEPGGVLRVLRTLPEETNAHLNLAFEGFIAYRPAVYVLAGRVESLEDGAEYPVEVYINRRRLPGERQAELIMGLTPGGEYTLVVAESQRAPASANADTGRFQRGSPGRGAYRWRDRSAQGCPEPDYSPPDLRDLGPTLEVDTDHFAYSLLHVTLPHPGHVRIEPKHGDQTLAQ